MERGEEEVKICWRHKLLWTGQNEKGLVITLGNPDPARWIAQMSTNDIWLSQIEILCLLKMLKLPADFHIITSAGEREYFGTVHSSG